MIILRALTLAVFMTLGGPLAGAVQAGGDMDHLIVHSPVRVSTVRLTKVTHGLQISLTLPSRTYPEGALIRAKMVVRNVSRHTILLGRLTCRQNPGIVVTDEAGNVDFPPALPGLAMFPCGPLLQPRPLRPGRKITRSEYVVLRAPHLQVQVDIALHAQVGPFTPPIKHIMGPAFTASLFPAPSPAVTMHVEQIGVSADLAPPAGVTGPYLYQEYWGYKTPDGGVNERYSSTQIWTLRQSLHLAPSWSGEYSQDSWWRVVAGWLNHPVAYITYGNDPLSPGD